MPISDRWAGELRFIDGDPPAACDTQSQALSCWRGDAGRYDETLWIGVQLRESLRSPSCAGN
jgi:hypothetical protein